MILKPKMALIYYIYVSQKTFVVSFMTDPAAQAYPKQLADQVAVPVYTLNQDVATWANKNLAGERLKQIYMDWKHIDTALHDRFLQLIYVNYKADFNLVKDRNPNMSFMDCY